MRVPVCAGRGAGVGFCGRAVGKTRAPPGHSTESTYHAESVSGLWQALAGGGLAPPLPASTRLAPPRLSPARNVAVQGNLTGLTWDHAGADGDLSDRAIQPGRWLVIHAKLQPLACSLNRLPKDGTAKHMPFCAPRVSPFPSGMVPKDRPIKPRHHPAAWLQRVQP